VTFRETESGSVHRSVMSIEPYGEIYGAHPGSFEFDANGTMLPVLQDVGILRLVEAGGLGEQNTDEARDTEPLVVKARLVPDAGDVTVEAEDEACSDQSEDSDGDMCFVGCRRMKCGR